MILVVLWGGRLGRGGVFTAVLIIIFSELLFLSFSFLAGVLAC